MNWKILGKIKKGIKKRQEEIIRVLLANRGLKTKKQISEFLSPPKPPKYSLKDLEINPHEVRKAIARIKKAIETHEKIIVYSDYDTDGICGAAILWESLNDLKANVLPYVPHRETEGYGLSEIGIDNLLTDEFYTKSGKVGLIITVDHGITANQAVLYAKKKGIDIIICDHHQKGVKNPEALAIVHTTKLCGAGVAYYFTQEFRKFSAYTENFLNINNLELAAVATIADMVPLTGANRSIVKYGLEQINNTKRVGLLELFTEAGLTLGNIGTYEVGFVIAPRLNAMGRLVHGLDALRLLCTKKKGKAEELAQILGLTNKERQDLTINTSQHAKNLWLEKGETQEKLIYLYHETYNAGVIGLVAGKLVEEFYKPAIVISKGEIYSKASARSIYGFNIIEHIRKASSILVNAGGHPMAAGFTVETKRLEELKKLLVGLANEELTEEQLIKTLRIDCGINFTDITLDLYNKIQEFTPFGMGNLEPVFCIKDVKINNYQLAGHEGKHLKLWISENGGEAMEGIAFGMGSASARQSSNSPKVRQSRPEQNTDLIGKKVELAFNLSLNSWNGKEKLQLKIKDMNY